MFSRAKDSEVMRFFRELVDGYLRPYNPERHRKAELRLHEFERDRVLARLTNILETTEDLLGDEDALERFPNLELWLDQIKRHSLWCVMEAAAVEAYGGTAEPPANAFLYRN